MGLQYYIGEEEHTMSNSILLSYDIFNELTSNDYSDDALNLFIHLGFRAGREHKIYVNTALLCDLTHTRSRVNLMHDLRQMEAYNYIVLSEPNAKGNFWITLTYGAFMPKTRFVVIEEEEFNHIQNNSSLIKLLYAIKKFRTGDSKISFSSYSTIEMHGNISQPTIARRLKDLEPILHIQPYTIKLADGTVIKRNFYKLKSDGELTFEEVTDIVADYYPNSTILHS